MVKRFMFSIAAIFVAVCGFSQDLKVVESPVQEVSGAMVVPKPVAFSLGPKVGINYALAGNPSEMNLGIGGNIGFSGGLAANIRFGKRPLTKFADTGRFGVQLEALYATHSLKSDIETLNMSCYEVPLLFQWWFVQDFCIEVGPTFTGVFGTSPKELRYNNAVFQTDKIKGNDVMLTVGVEYKTQKGFTASLRYNHGNSDLAGNFQTKVSTVSFGIGWLFSIVK